MWRYQWLLESEIHVELEAFCKATSDTESFVEGIRHVAVLRWTMVFALMVAAWNDFFWVFQRRKFCRLNLDYCSSEGACVLFQLVELSLVELIHAVKGAFVRLARHQYFQTMTMHRKLE